MLICKTKKRRLILALMTAMVFVVASWTMAGAAQLTVNCSTAPCAQASGTYDIGIGGYSVDQNGNITIALDSAPYSGVIAGTVNPLPPIPDVTVYLRKSGPSTGLADLFYTLDPEDALGNYEFIGLPDGNYVVTVIAGNYQFVNPSHTVKILNGIITKIDGAAVGTNVDVNFVYAPPADGDCGTSNGGTFTSAPTTNLCDVGTPTTVSGSGPWNWTCQGSNGGSDTSCSANKPAPVAGVCGTSNGGTFTTIPTTNLCQDGSSPVVGGSGPWNWTCQGLYGGSNASCSANKTGSPVNGTCGTSSGGTFTTAPTTNLCGSGTATTVSGSGPWSWSCQGLNGGTTVTSCYANKEAVVGLIDIGGPYPKTTSSSVAAGQAKYYHFYTTTAAKLITIQMTTADWTGNLDLMASNVKSPTCDQITLRSSMGTNGLWYGPVSTSNEVVNLSLTAPAGTHIYVTICNRTQTSASSKVYWSSTN